MQDTDVHRHYTLVRHRTTDAVGWVLRTDHFGVFVEWGVEARYAHERDLDTIGGTAQAFVDELLSIIRFLHPDQQPDPTTMTMARANVGDHAAVLMADIVRNP